MLLVLFQQIQGVYIMLTKLALYNWKSYKFSEIDISEPITVLVGANAGGKSNVLDALLFLHRLILGNDITQALMGSSEQKGIRGGLEWAFLKDTTSTALQVTISDADNIHYEYRIEIEKTNEITAQIKSEQLTRYRMRKNGKQTHEIKIFNTLESEKNSPSLTARLYNGKGGSNRSFQRSKSIISQISQQLQISNEVKLACKSIFDDLSQVFLFDPIPSHMRGYTQLSSSLDSDAANLAGVIAALPEKDKINIEDRITNLVKDLPECDIEKVFAQVVGPFKTDAMLYCKEEWLNSDKEFLLDSRGMSDGTLRFIAIITALLTKQANSLIVIEEIDNGLHPHRAEHLLKSLVSICESKRVRVIFTTHNPSLLDALVPKYIPFVTIVHRSTEDGSSKLTPLTDIKNLAKFLAQGTLGQAVSRGQIQLSFSV